MFPLLLTKNKLLSFILSARGHWKGKLWRKREESRLFSIEQYSEYSACIYNVSIISKYTYKPTRDQNFGPTNMREFRSCSVKNDGKNMSHESAKR